MEKSFKKMKIFKVSHNHELIEAVIDLGNKNAKTLGFFPEGAFIEHARKKNILVATEDGELCGYLLFRITQKTRVVSITHLCIDHNYRNQGIAKKLLDFLKKDYQQILRGFKLNCRKDYIAASKFWEKYGFKPVSGKRSRSKKERYLITWWYDFGNEDLFSFSYRKSNKIQALLDASIIIKLRDIDRINSNEIKALNADWLFDEVEYYYAPEIYNEINRDKNKARIKTTRNFVRSFNEARFKPEKRDIILSEIEQLLSGNSVNDKSDRKQLSECIASGISYFLTTDKNLLSINEEVFEKYSTNILRPSDFILYIDELINGLNYQSYRVSGVNYDYKKIGALEIDTLVEKFLQYPQGEKKHALRDKLTSIAAETEKNQFKLVKNDLGDCIGFYATKESKNKIQVEVIRTGSSTISDILFQQILYDIIQQAVRHNFNFIEILDEYLSDEEKSILNSFGFQREKAGWIRLVLSGVKPFDLLLKEKPIQKYWNVSTVNTKIKLLPEENSQSFKLDKERAIWPFKIEGLDLPTYIIPIKPYWAAHLFDFYLSQNNIFGANPKLSWSRENIYYRNVKPVSEKSPGRILWYLSTNTSNRYSPRQKGISACSYIDEVHIGSAKQLYTKFKNYGVYTWSDIYKMTNKNSEKLIKAIKFSDTEVFDNIISLKTIHEIFASNDKPKNTFVSPVEISESIFLDIYKKGINYIEDE